MAAEVIDGLLWTLQISVSPAFEPLAPNERAQFTKRMDRALKSAKFRRFTQSLEKTAPIVTLFVALVSIFGPRVMLALESRKHATNAIRRGPSDSNGPGPDGNVHRNGNPPPVAPPSGNTDSPNGRAANVRETIGVIREPPIR